MKIMKNKEKFLKLVNSVDNSWLDDFKKDLSNNEDFEINMKIVLKIIHFMKDNHLKQVDLASMLNVSPQYVNRLLGGGENISIAKAEEYGRMLGIRLIDVPSEDSFSFNKIKSYKAIRTCPVKVKENTISNVPVTKKKIRYIACETIKGISYGCCC